MSEVKQVTIYTDGAAVGNPGPGGYGVVLMYGAHRRELAGGFRLTTNNRMELMAAIVGLEALKTRCAVTLYSDSEYLVKAMTDGWAVRWRSRGWRRTRSERAANVDLWERLLALASQHEVTFVHVKGHAGNPENERCDRLAETAARQGDLPADTVFEAEVEGGNRDQRIEMQEGDPCGKCGTPVVKRQPRKLPKAGQTYYFEYYFYCPQCRAAYMVEGAKREVGASGLPSVGLFGELEDEAEE